MRAIVYEGVRDVKVKNVGDPAIINQDDIIVKVTSTAICGSDLHLIHGMVPNMPEGFVLGHETMGIVEEVGDEVHKLKKAIVLSFLFQSLVGIVGTVSMTCGANVIIPIPMGKRGLILATARPLEAMMAGRLNT